MFQTKNCNIQAIVAKGLSGQFKVKFRMQLHHITKKNGTSKDTYLSLLCPLLF